MPDAFQACWFWGKEAIKQVVVFAESLSSVRSWGKILLSTLFLGKETYKRAVLYARSLLNKLLLGEEAVKRFMFCRGAIIAQQQILGKPKNSPHPWLEVNLFHLTALVRTYSWTVKFAPNGGLDETNAHFFMFLPHCWKYCILAAIFSWRTHHFLCFYKTAEKIVYLPRYLGESRVISHVFITSLEKSSFCPTIDKETLNFSPLYETDRRIAHLPRYEGKNCIQFLMLSPKRWKNRVLTYILY